MTTLYFVIQIFSIVYLSVFGPVFLFTQLRCLIHDRAYMIGVYDYLLGVCVTAIVLLGLPVL